MSHKSKAWNWLKKNLLINTIMIKYGTKCVVGDVRRGLQLKTNVASTHM